MAVAPPVNTFWLNPKPKPLPSVDIIDAALKLQADTGCSLHEAVVAVETQAAFADHDSAAHLHLFISSDDIFEFGFNDFKKAL